MNSEPVAAVTNAIHIVELLSENDSLGVGEISNTIDISKTTAHRLLQSLIEVNLIKQDQESKKYSLTFKLFELGAKVFGNSSLVQAANGPMTRLNDLVGETVHLGVFDSNAMVYLQKVDAKHTIRLASKIGKIAPLHSTAIGKALLAWRDQASINKIANELNYTIRTPQTIRTPEEYIKHLKQVKKDGYAIDQEENEEGIICFAVPVFDYNESTVAALSVSTPCFRLKEKQKPKLIKLLIKFGREISLNLGYRP